MGETNFLPYEETLVEPTRYESSDNCVQSWTEVRWSKVDKPLLKYALTLTLPPGGGNKINAKKEH